MDTGDFVIAGSQVVLLLMVWFFSAKGTISTLVEKVAQLELRLGNGNGVPTRCALHEATLKNYGTRIGQLEEKGRQGEGETGRGRGGDGRLSASH